MYRIGVDGHNLEKTAYGVGQYVSHIISSLNQIRDFRKNFEVIVYCKGHIPDHPIFRFPNVRGKILRFIKPSFTLFYNILLPRAYRKDGIDVMWFPNYMLPLGFKGRSIVTIHDIVYEEHPEWIPLRYRIPYRLLSRHASRHATAITTVSRWSKKCIKSVYRMAGDVIHVVYPGISEVFFKKSDQNSLAQLKKRFGVKKRYFMYACQMFSRRYPVESIMAFAACAAKFPDVQFLVVGRNMTDPYIDVDKLCTHYNFQLNRNAFVRAEYIPQDELSVLFRGAEFFVYISTYEGFGMPPVEAARCGIPSVVFKYGPLKETLGSYAYLIKNPKNAREIADTFEYLLSHPQEAILMGKKAQKRVIPFTWEKAAHDMKKVIDAVIQAKKHEHH